MGFRRYLLPISIVVALLVLTQIAWPLLSARATPAPPTASLGAQTALPPVLATAVRPFLRAQDLELATNAPLGEVGWETFQWSPDGSRMLLGIGGVMLATLDVKTGKLLYMPVPSSEFLGPVWSPDGQAIAYAAPLRWLPATFSDGHKGYWPQSLDAPILQIIQLNDEFMEPSYQITDTLRGLGMFIQGRPISLPDLIGTPLAWLLDGRLVYRDDNGFWTLRADQALKASDEFEAPQPLAGLNSKDAGGWISPAPDGRAFVVADMSDPGMQNLWMVRPDGTRVNFDRSPAAYRDCCAWAPDGSYLTFFSNDPLQGIYRVDRTGQDRQRVFPAIAIAEPGDFVSMGISPDAQVIAFEWAKHGVDRPLDHTDLYLVNVNGSGLNQLTRDARSYRTPRWSPDGMQIAYQRDVGQVWLIHLRQCAAPFGC